MPHSLNNMSKTIIERMCSISEKMRPDADSKEMSLSLMKNAQADISALCKTLEMTPMQVVILTAIVANSSRYRIESSSIASFLGLEYLKFLTYNDETEGLRRMGYLRIDSHGDFVLPKFVLKNLRQNIPVIPEPTTGLDALGLLNRISKMLALCKEDQCSADDAVTELNDLMESNPDNSISRTMRKYAKLIPHTEKMILYGLVYRYYYEDDDMVGWYDLDDYFEDDRLGDLKGRYRHESLALQYKGIIEYARQGGVLSKDFFRLKDEIKDEFFADVGGCQKKAPRVKASRVVEAGTIAPKELFYNAAEGRQVSQLRSLLGKDRLDGVRDNLKSKGLRSGFTCLFYGAPGTGKTETVYQLARETGRDIYMVDVAQIKSCWVGESEKNIKDVFVRYRACVNAGGVVPILLFNEADAVFGIRQEGAERAVDKMENSIQNIILQEMEDLDGILIATTNLTSNLDKAFERRFLYKLRFDKPSSEARSQIWKSMIPELAESDIQYLSGKFDLSGGQIENIARKRIIGGILSGEDASIEEMLRYCCEEDMGGRTERRKIGF